MQRKTLDYKFQENIQRPKSNPNKFRGIIPCLSSVVLRQTTFLIFDVDNDIISSQNHFIFSRKLTKYVQFRYFPNQVTSSARKVSSHIKKVQTHFVGNIASQLNALTNIYFFLLFTLFGIF